MKLIHKIEIIIITLLILLLPIMMYIDVGGTKVNLSIADFLLVLVGLLFLFNIKEFFVNRRWIYLLYFFGLLLSLFVSQWLSLRNDEFHHVGNSVMLMEMVKTTVVAAYFFSAFIFIRDEKSYRLALNTISFSSIPVLVIGFSSYLYYIQGKEFPLEAFAIKWQMRFLGTFEDPNLAALYLLVVFYISLCNFKFLKNWMLRGLMIGIICLSFIAILLTMSRGGWLGLAVALVALVIWNWRTFARRSAFFVLPLVIVGLLFTNIDLTSQEGKITNSIVDRIQTSLNGNIDNVDRVLQTKAAIQMGNDNFLTGVGKGSYPLNTYKYLGEDSPIYKNQYIPHNTLAGFYAEQGILGLFLFLSLPGYLFYRMVRTKKWQYSFFIPLSIGILVHSMTINIENVRFIWFFLGLILVSEIRGIALEPVPAAKVSRKAYAIVLSSMVLVAMFLFIDLSRKLAVNIYVANGNVYEKQVAVNEPGDYLLSFDVQSYGKRHEMKVFDGNNLIETIEFASAKGLVQLPIHLENAATITFQSHEEGWMRVNNAYLMKGEKKIPLYNYVLLPTWGEDWLNQHNWLDFLEVPSFKEKFIVADNELGSLHLLDARLIRYGNLTHVLEFDLNRQGAIEKDYQFELLLGYDSIHHQLPGEPQRNHFTHRFGLYPPTSRWEEGKTYTVKTNRLLSYEQFNLFGRYYEPQDQVYIQESFFPIDFEVQHKQQEILPLGNSQWINVRYGKDDEDRIKIRNNGWVESGRMNFEPGSYELTFNAQGSFYEEFSKLRLRDSSLNIIAEFTLDDTMKEYRIVYNTDEHQKGISFVLELINQKYVNDVGKRDVLLEDWLSVEKLAE